MEKETIRAGKFKLRSELESHVRNNVGLTPEIKVDFVIEGTAEELGRLQLSSRTLFWGIRCRVTDEKTKEETGGKVERGDFNSNHGVNKK